MALVAVPGAVVEIDPDREGAPTVWEVGVLSTDGTGVEVYVDAATGQVLRQSALTLDSEQRTAPAVTAAQAMEIALAAASDRIDSVDLGTDRGRIVWEIIVIGPSGGVEIYIDAATGEVVKQEAVD